METLSWTEDTDENDNSTWIASSCYVSDDCPFMWRVRAELQGNRVIWAACHDSELGGEGDWWETLEDAKRLIESRHNEMIAAEKRLAAAPVS